MNDSGAGESAFRHRSSGVPSERPNPARVEGHHSRNPYNELMYSVYIVRCADGTLYTGLARDPHARLKVHNSGKGAKYTRARLPVSLVYVEACESLSTALKRERQLKPWSRARKEALIAGDPAMLKKG